MRFRRTFSITVDCFPEVFKLLAYRLLTGILFGSLGYLILSLGLSFIVSSSELAAFGDLLPDFFRALADTINASDPAAFRAFLETVRGAIKDFADLLMTNMGSIVGSVIGVVLMYILQRIVNGVALFAITSSVRDRMDSGVQTRFAVSYFRNLTKAILYELCYVPIAFVFDLLSIIVSWCVFFYIPSLMPGWGVASVLLSLVMLMSSLLFLQALKLTIISAWMPAMIVDGLSVGRALAVSVKGKTQFWRRLGGFLVTCYLIVVVNVAFGLFTLGSGLLITIPLSFVFLAVMQLVNYYEVNGRKYFVTRNEIANLPEEFGTK